MIDHRDLPLLAVFAMVVKHGTFTAAARELRLAKSVVSEQVRTLEERFSARLLERTTRQLRLTQIGEQVYASAERILASLDGARAAAEAHRDAPTGTLRVAATLDLGRRFVGPVVASLCAAHDLSAALYFDDKEIDLVGLGVDAAVRVGVPRDSTFMARKLAEDEEIIVASSVLAARWSHVRKPRELSAAPWVAHASLVGMVQQQFIGPRGDKDELARGEPRAICSNADGLRALTCAGVGFAALPSHLIAEELRDGRVVRVLPDWYRRKVGIYLLLPSRRHLPRRVALFADAIAAAIRAAQLGIEPSVG